MKRKDCNTQSPSPAERLPSLGRSRRALQFPLGNPENVSGKLEIHFDDLIVESIQRKTFREIQKRRKAERRKRAKKRDGSSKDNQPNQENCFIDA